jgi:hypothetical protein
VAGPKAYDAMTPDDGAREEKKIMGNIMYVHKFLFFAKIPNHWRLTLFIFDIFIWNLANSLICQMKNTKRLGML